MGQHTEEQHAVIILSPLFDHITMAAITGSSTVIKAAGLPGLARKASKAPAPSRIARRSRFGVQAFFNNNKKVVEPEPTSLDKAKELFANPLVSKGMWSVAAGIALATDAAYIDPQEWISNVGMSPDLVPVIQEKLQQVAVVHVLCLAGVAYFIKEKELDLSTAIKSLGK